MNVSPIDVAVIAIYLIGITAFGIWIGYRRDTSSQQYFLANKSLGWFTVGAAVFTSNISTLHLVGLGARMDHFPAQLSGGEQQRVAIARAIAKRPAVLMCDEPTGALDVRTGMAVLEAIEQINRDLGTLTLIITHNSVMASMADRVLTLSDGHITGEKRNATRAAASSLAW